jgi:DNA-binding transcriptional ArsR family regulator
MLALIKKVSACYYFGVSNLNPNMPRLNNPKSNQPTLISEVIRGRRDSSKLRHRLSWWIPIWKGLVTDDGKHRKTIGSSIWVYLYLLLYMNHSSGLVFRTQKEISLETGLGLRSVQKHFARLKKHGYVRAEKQGKTLKIFITNWKTFWDKKRNTNSK